MLLEQNVLQDLIQQTSPILDRNMTLCRFIIHQNFMGFTDSKKILPTLMELCKTS